MRKFWIGLFALVAACAARIVPPHPQGPTERAVYIAPEVRRQLAAAWDTVNPKQHERGYCLGVLPAVSVSGDSVWVVVVATRAVALSDGPSHVQFDCGTRATVHTHVPTTCRVTMAPDFIRYEYDSCRLGGPGSDVTWPSPGDYAALEQRTGRPFDLIQFSAQGFTVYYPRQ